MGSPSRVRVGIVLPESYYGAEEWRNAEAALQSADEAAAQGVELLLYPYDYWRDGPDTWKESFKRIYKDDYDRIVAKSGGSFRFRKT